MSVLVVEEVVVRNMNITITIIVTISGVCFCVRIQLSHNHTENLSYGVTLIQELLEELSELIHGDGRVVVQSSKIVRAGKDDGNWVSD